MIFFKFKKLTIVIILQLICLTFGNPPLANDWETNLNIESPQVKFKRARLPHHIIPKNYLLEVQPIFQNSTHGEILTCPGKIWMDVEIKNDTDIVTFHSALINIKQEELRVYEKSTNRNLTINKQEYDEANQFYHVTLDQVLPQGSSFTIYVEFIAKIPDNSLFGLYLSSYKDENGNKRYLAATHFEPTHARKAFPCFDEISLKAKWEIRIMRTVDYHTLSNMHIVETSNVDGMEGWEMDVYEVTELMSTYLVCFAITDYDSRVASTEHYRLNTTIWATPPLVAEGAADYAANFSAKVMKVYEDLFGINYTFSKMDEIAIPDYSIGAMENWGLNTYRESRLLWIEGVSYWSDLVALSSTVSHEISHQWFGNLVTPSWWLDAWLKEGFATYWAPIITSEIYPSYYLLNSVLTSYIQSALIFDATANSHPMHDVSVESPDEITSHMDTITYNKGGSVIRMMNSFVGEETFMKAMRALLIKFEYSILDQDDLFDVIEETIGESSKTKFDGMTLHEIMHSWTTQTGFPVLEVKRNDIDDITTITQSKYFPLDAENKTDDTRWNVPIFSFVEGDAEPFKLTGWLKKTDVEFTAIFPNNTFFIINPQQRGFCRILYDSLSLELIRTQLLVNHEVIDSSTRSALMDDNLNLAFAKYLDINSALDLTLYLKKERDLVPWITFTNNMAYSRRMFSRLSIFSKFRNYILDLIKEPLTQIGYNYTDGDSDKIGEVIMLRTRLLDWACALQESNCIKYSLESMAKWMTEPENPSVIVPDVQPIVYCAAVAHGGDDIWNFVFEQYTNFDRFLLPDVMQLNLLRALACSKSSSKLNMLLQMSIAAHSNIRNDQRAAAIQAVAANSIGTDLTFNFIRNYFSYIMYLNGNLFVSAVQTLSTYFNSPIEYVDLEMFLEAKSDKLKEYEGQLENSLKTIRNNINWIDEHYPAYSTWLKTLAKSTRRSNNYIPGKFKRFSWKKKLRGPIVTY